VGVDAVTSRIAAAVVLAAAAAYLAGLAAGTGAAVLAALAGLALVPAAVQSADLLTRRASTSLLLGGALVFLTLTLAFDGGGYLESGPPFGVAVLALTWATGLIVAPREAFARSTPLIVAVAALTALAIWAGLSQLWSNSSALAWPGAGRALLYAMALALFGGMAGVRISAARLLRFVTLTLVGVLAAGLLARLAPDLLQTPVIRGGKRISYPLGYWNGMAFVAAAAFAFCFHLTSQRAEPALVRVLAGAAIPVIAATEFLTFSRGGLVSCLVALVVYVALTAERSMLLGASTACIAAAAAVGVVASADALSAQAKLTGSGLSEGHRVAYLLLLLTVLTAIARAAGCFVERSRPAPRIRARPVLAGVLAICLVVLGVGVALADSSVRRHLSHTFQEARGKPAKRSNDLGFINSRGRVDEWKVVLKGFDGSPLHGSGADTFANLWMVHRPPRSEAGTEAHSLYLETLGELGVVGLGLLLVALSQRWWACFWRGWCKPGSSGSGSSPPRQCGCSRYSERAWHPFRAGRRRRDPRTVCSGSRASSRSPAWRLSAVAWRSPEPNPSGRCRPLPTDPVATRQAKRDGRYRLPTSIPSLGEFWATAAPVEAITREPRAT
jgi:hypothetical protein